jgi:adenine-specific DNA-methyltransferase
MLKKRISPQNEEKEQILLLIKSLIPEAFPDGVVDWDVLSEVLNPDGDDELSPENYGLTWPGKSDARRLAAIRPTGTLKYQKGEGTNEEQSSNIYIEGENLEVLKHLRRSYTGKVKMIYIAPPYNTGSDHFYIDDFSESIQGYLIKTKQVSSTAPTDLLTTNPKTGGRFHSKWLNMIYPRLKVARDLLSESGAIFVSIDDNEAHNLKLVMDELYGAENFVCSLVWEKRYSPPPDTKEVGYVHELILFYKRSDTFKVGMLPFTDEQKSRYKNPDNDSRGPWKPMDYTCRYTADERENLYYPVVNPNTKEVIWPKRTRVWAFSKETHDKNVNEDRIWWGKDGKGSTPALKNFLTDIKQGMMPSSLLHHTSVGNTDEATKELRQLFPELKYIPKPIRLIKHLILLSGMQPNNGDILLDFFAGSSTSAHAVLELNAEDGGNRKFIMVQIPEMINDDYIPNDFKYRNMSELSKERIRRVIRNINSSKLDAKASLGFRVFKLSQSNYKEWRPYEGNSLEGIKDLFSEHESPLVDGWTPEAVLDEIILLEGFPLDSDVDDLAQFSYNAVQCVSSPMCGHQLWVCLDEKLHEATIVGLETALTGDDILICLDTALDDNTKLRLTQLGKLKTI